MMHARESKGPVRAMLRARSLSEALTPFFFLRESFHCGHRHEFRAWGGGRPAGGGITPPPAVAKAPSRACAMCPVASWV